MTRFIKLLLPLLAVLAVGYAQVYGMKRSFLCEHKAQPVEIQAEHCHSIGGGASGYSPCDKKAKEACPAEGSTGHHQGVSLELKSGAASTSSVVAPPLYALILSEIPSFEWRSIQTKTEAESSLFEAWVDSGDIHLASAVQVAKSMVLLV